MASWMTAPELYERLVAAEKLLGRQESFTLIRVDQCEIIQHPNLRPPIQGELEVTLRELMNAGLIVFARAQMKGEFRLTNPDLKP